MLVICNGAIKSGSTWLYNILYELREFKRPPDHYLTDASRQRTRNPCIRPSQFSSFLESEDIQNNDFMSKNHLGQPWHRDLLMSNDNVFVFDIERDIRDVVVSSYYDDCNRHGYQRSFSDFYWDRGRYKADEVLRYHDTWRHAGSRFLMVSYAGLHRDFSAEVLPMTRMLDVELDADGLLALQEKTSMGSLRKRYQDEELYKNDKFFRKGIVGDWQNHFDDAMIADIAAIQQGGIRSLDRRLLGKKFRRALNKIRRY